MKARRLVPGQIVNPFYSHDARRAARDRGEPYDVTPFLTLPKDEIVDDSDCWKLCIGDNAVMAPADDECRQAVLAAMGSEKRKKFLQNLKRQNMPEIRRQMSKAQAEWLDVMIESYGSEIDALDVAAVATET